MISFTANTYIEYSVDGSASSNPFDILEGYAIQKIARKRLTI